MHAIQRVCCTLLFQLKVELASHLSLLSLANGWPLPLQHSQQLCQVFHRDIRKLILHLQLTLSWQPSDPMALLSHDVGVTEPVSSSLGKFDVKHC